MTDDMEGSVRGYTVTFMDKCILEYTTEEEVLRSVSLTAGESCKDASGSYSQLESAPLGG